MRVIKIVPGSMPVVAEVENTIEALQEEVGGYIESYPMEDELVFLCDENGWMNDKPYNFDWYGNRFVGTVLIVSVDGENFCSVPGWFDDAEACLRLSRGSIVRKGIAYE